MRQVRFAILAGVGVVVLCFVAVAGSLMEYVSHPEVANVHVPPVIVTPTSSPADQAPAAAPAPITTSVPVDASPSTPTPQPVAAAPSRVVAQSSDLARLLQQFQQRRHRVPRQ